MGDKIAYRFTDIHLDAFYKYQSDIDQACHAGDGHAGFFGSETTNCDSPRSLVNATFAWIKENLRDSIDFVIWTGDSARHDSDEEIPRTEKEVVGLNEMLVDKFVEVFGKLGNINDTDPTNDFVVPIIPNFGNNDILPHNIFAPGPNKWTRMYTSIWNRFIPEEQRHSFERGGWFFVEVIPKQLAVFSLNTLYFFDSNAAVDGCTEKSEPGYEQMEWLRIQLQFLRERGMKAILTGHVPPARTESKISWDETCWQKYTLWMHQYRDVVISSIYGHMNIDHFMLQDFHDVKDKSLNRKMSGLGRGALEDRVTLKSSASYLTELRSEWAHLPYPATAKICAPKDRKGLDDRSIVYRTKKGFQEATKRKEKGDKLLEKLGGRWGERYSLSLVSASVIPNAFPSLRVFDYNITGLTHTAVPIDTSLDTVHDQDGTEVLDGVFARDDRDLRKGSKRSKKAKKPKKPKFVIPNPPSKSAPPGPAYSPQTLSLLGYTQYYANLTEINEEFANKASASSTDSLWPKASDNGEPKVSTANFKYKIEYDTRNDKIFGLKDLTVPSYINLAARIGHYKPRQEDVIGDVSTHPPTNVETSKKKQKKHKKHKKRKGTNKIWFEFVKRAFVGSKSDEELHEEFG